MDALYCFVISAKVLQDLHQNFIAFLLHLQPITQSDGIRSRLRRCTSYFVVVLPNGNVDQPRLEKRL
jgi:hypothetical protein